MPPSLPKPEYTPGTRSGHPSRRSDHCWPATGSCRTRHRLGLLQDRRCYTANPPSQLWPGRGITKRNLGHQAVFNHPTCTLLVQVNPRLLQTRLDVGAISRQRYDQSGASRRGGPVSIDHTRILPSALPETACHLSRLMSTHFTVLLCCLHLATTVLSCRDGMVQCWGGA